MNHETKSLDRTAARLRKIARIWSVVVVVLAVVYIVSSIFIEDPNLIDPVPWQEYLGPASLLVSVTGLVIAWRWEGLGAAINISFFLAALVILRILRGEQLAPWVYANLAAALSPIVIPGVLFLLCSIRARSPGRANSL